MNEQLTFWPDEDGDGGFIYNGLHDIKFPDDIEVPKSDGVSWTSNRPLSRPVGRLTVTNDAGSTLHSILLGQTGSRVEALKIGAHQFQVRWEENPEHEDGDRLLGDSCLEYGYIRLRRAMTGTIEKETLIHEVLHMIWAMNGLESTSEESCVASIGAGLTQVLVDNPWFAKMMTA